MNRRTWLIGIGAALLVALLGGMVWFVASNMERTQREVTLPPQGEAAYNPLYALKRSLEHAGIPVQSRRRLEWTSHVVGPTDTVVIRGDVRRTLPEETDAIDAWVRAGGHLLVELPPVIFDGSDANPGDTVLSRIGVRPYGVDYACQKLRVQDGQQVTLCGRVTAELSEDVEVLNAWVTASDDIHYVRVAHGRGTVDVLSSLDVLGNEHLEKPGHAAFARQLLAPGYGHGTVHLIYEARMTPLWQLLLKRGWPVWIPGVLALLGWMFRRSQRFGPWLPAPAADRRSLLEHMQASGWLLQRHGKGALLYSAIREQFFIRLRQRAPHAAVLDGTAQQQAIAGHLGVPESEVQAALMPPLPDNTADLQRRIALLNRMRRQL